MRPTASLHKKDAAPLRLGVVLATVRLEHFLLLRCTVMEEDSVRLCVPFLVRLLVQTQLFDLMDVKVNVHVVVSLVDRHFLDCCYFVPLLVLPQLWFSPASLTPPKLGLPWPQGAVCIP